MTSWKRECQNVATLYDVNNSEIKGSKFAHNLQYLVSFYSQKGIYQNGNIKHREINNKPVM